MAGARSGSPAGSLFDLPKQLTGRIRGGTLDACVSVVLLCNAALLCSAALSAASAAAQVDTETCLACHDDPDLLAEDGRSLAVSAPEFAASVHGDFDCIDCHTAPVDYDDIPHSAEYVPVDCSVCHEGIFATYCSSVHLLGRLGSAAQGAGCADCHTAHHILPAADAGSPTHASRIPDLCGRCHAAAERMVTGEHVRLPMSVPNYRASIHGAAWAAGAEAAVCTDCHGVHDLQSPQHPASLVHPLNLATTCGGCHAAIAAEYQASIHGRAVALGFDDAPTCTDCHGEHLIRGGDDPLARTAPAHQAQKLCGDCHADAAFAAKYGMTREVVDSYLDSYHGWVVAGGDLAASCTDCHNVHEIRSKLDPASSVHLSNVAATCGRCHASSNETFALSYTHASAHEAGSPHWWIRWIYISLIAGVLGAMALHNLIIARRELAQHLSRRRRESYVRRWGPAERLQHLVLLITFIGLAITGFALRFPGAWWVKAIGLTGQEALRANLHRVLGVIMIAASIYHIGWLALTRRGRWSLREIAPRIEDVYLALQNILFHLGLRRHRPDFRAFDYTQKAEYWAVVWGTIVMALSGLVLWFPTAATGLLPGWIVRVAEVIHFYEAILAVSAIIIWHFFYVIFMPHNYPVSTIWLNGRMPASEWKEAHRAEYLAMGEEAIRTPPPPRRE